MTLYALVEEWPHESLISFLELPGCLIGAPTTAEALRNAPAVVAAYLDWLREQSISWLDDTITPLDIVVKELVRADHIGPRFQADLVAPTEREMEHALSVAEAARAQLATLYSAVSPENQSRRPKPGEWSLAEHMQHLLAADAHYVGCLSDQPPDDPPLVPASELADKLSENGRRYAALLRGLTPEQRAQVYTHGEAEWTAAKVLRRMSEHLRDHYPWMQAIAEQLRVR